MDYLAFRSRARLAFLFVPSLAVTLGSNANPQKKAGQIVPSASMNVARAGHTATLLRDGTVLIAGGMLRNGDFTSTAETYDPKTNGFTLTKNMLIGRVGAAAAMLPSGKVLIVGGWNVTDEAEIYDPASRGFTAVAKMNQRRARPTATALNDGNVLITGGEVDGNTLTATSSAEIFDERSGKFTPVGAMHVPRSAHTATLLRDGRVLVVGGTPARHEVTDTAEVYNPTTRSFTVVGRLSVPRYKHTAGQLSDGMVLIAGGSDFRDWNGAYDSAEIFDPRKNIFGPAGKMPQARFKLPPEAALVGGKMLVFGGAPGAALYNEQSVTFETVAGSNDTERFYPSATVLPNGQVLLAGGYPRNPPYDATRGAWLFVPGH